jgi:transposase InsO family protein
VRLRASGGAVNGGGGGGGGDGGGSQALDEASMGQLFAVLKDHADALQRLQEVLRRWGWRGWVCARVSAWVTATECVRASVVVCACVCARMPVC